FDSLILHYKPQKPWRRRQVISEYGLVIADFKSEIENPKSEIELIKFFPSFKASVSYTGSSDLFFISVKIFY
ncbi:MAG TPA: hypothetical protein DCZ51_02920, partial [Bacteroidales bacterium]|nr:hypothetical protein [Bacteroidales bacterium]